MQSNGIPNTGARCWTETLHCLTNYTDCALFHSLPQRFIQYLASRTSLFNLSNFIDKTGSHGKNAETRSANGGNLAIWHIVQARSRLCAHACKQLPAFPSGVKCDIMFTYFIAVFECSALPHLSCRDSSADGIVILQPFLSDLRFILSSSKNDLSVGSMKAD